MKLTEPQQQAVAVIVDRAMRHAADSLAEAIGAGLALSLRHVDLTASDQAVARIAESARSRPAVAVRQNFTGSFSGEAVFALCEQCSLELVRSLLSDAVPLDAMTDLEQDALTEVGNVVLNACLSSIAAQLGRSLTSAVPHYARGTAAQVLSCEGPGEACYALSAHLGLGLRSKGVDAFVMVLMDIVSAERFLDCIDFYLQKA